MPSVPTPPSAARATRYALYGGGIVGALLLIVAEFLPIVSIRVITVVEDEQIGFDRHGSALLILGLAALIFLVGAWRGGSRPAMIAVAGIGLAAALIALLVDLPDLNEVGSYGERYDRATSEVGAGFYLETLGAVLLIACGGGLLLSGDARERRPRSRATPAESPPTAG
jgi:hypothetical protein